ncbi:MAG: hypothetical protein WBF58_08885 [Xanthobacteraceae bacterium]
MAALAHLPRLGQQMRKRVPCKRRRDRFRIAVDAVESIWIVDPAGAIDALAGRSQIHLGIYTLAAKSL